MTKPVTFPRSAPEAQGISSRAVLAFVDEIEKNALELHSFMLLRHGLVIAEGWWDPYRPQSPHMLFSLSKSFTSSAVGLAVSEGLLSLEDEVLSFFADKAPAKPGKNLKEMRIRHLLTMSTGHARDTTSRMVSRQDGDWVIGFLSLPVRHKPGTHFVYNSGASYMLSAILQKVAGVTLLDYLRPRVFEPLGIDNPVWETCPRGINTGGWGLSIRTEDIARFGQMYLQMGDWNGKQILPSAWVKEATSFQISNAGNRPPDWQQGYGYQFWRCRHGAYRGDGAFGQYCVVMPAQDAVLAITSGVKDMQAVLDAVWGHLLPAMVALPLPVDKTSHQVLAGRLAGLALRPPAGRRAPALAAAISGRIYKLQSNELRLESASFELNGERCLLTLGGSQGAQQVACGFGEWIDGRIALVTPTQGAVAASAAWKSAETLAVTLRMIETPFTYTLTSRFHGNEVEIHARPNLSFGPVKAVRIVGQSM